MSRKLIQIKGEEFLGFGCSECNWVFNSSVAFTGKTINEMKAKYVAQRDKEFAVHVCSDTPKSHESKD